MSVHLTDITAKNFNSRLKTWAKHTKSVRDSLQAFIVFGLIHYDKEGDTVYLSKIQKEVSKLRAIPAKTIQEYIMVHANVYLIKEKGTGYPVYKKRKGEEVKVSLPSVVWYDHHVNNKNKVDFNLEKYEQAVIKKLEKEGVDLGKFASDILMLVKNKKAA